MFGIILENVKRRRWVWMAGALLLLVSLLLLTRNFSKEKVDILTVGEREWLKAHPVIRFAPDPDFPPVEYFNRNGEYNGITADYIALIEKKLGIRFKIVRLRNWDEIIAKAKSRQIDMYAATKNPQRSEYLLFTMPFMEFPTAIIAREKVKDPLTLEKLNGMKVSVVSGYATHDYISLNYPKLNLDVVPDVQTGLRKVSFGMSDAFVENLATASYYIEKEGIANLRIVGESGYDYRMAFASRSDWPELNRILVKGLARISPDEKKTVYKKWMPLEPWSLFSSKKFQAVILTAFGLAVLIISGIIAWNRALAKQVRRRTCELEKELIERKRVEDALRESEEKFRVLAETSPAAIIVYQGEKHVYVNPSVTRLIGYTEQECLEMRFWDWVHEDFREKVRCRGLARQQGEEEPSQYEIKGVTRSGEEKWVFVSAGRIEYRGAPAGIVSIFDITDLKRAEESLRTLNEELENRVAARTSDLAALNADLLQEIAERKRVEEELLLSRFCIDKAAIGIYQTSFEAGILSVNDFACRSLGYTSDELYTMSVFDIDPSITMEKMLEIKKSLDETGSATHETTHRRKDGTTFPVEITANYVEFQGKSSTFSFVKDITDRKRAEEQLRQKSQLLETLNSTLEKRVQEEVEKNRAKDHILIQQNRQAALGETLDHIAHQWKQPITAISLIIQDMGETYLHGDLTKEYVYETVEKILDLVEHMAQTITVFRDFYKPDKERTMFRIKESIDNALMFVEPALRYQAIKVELEADPELSASGYPREYAQVLLNILSNAKDVLKERGVKSPCVKIKAFAEGHKAVVTITDNAGGIPEEFIGKVFDLYFTTKESSGGTGIGLYMSKNIIEKNMGGELSVGNADCGAQFRIELKMPSC